MKFRFIVLAVFAVFAAFAAVTVDAHADAPEPGSSALVLDADETGVPDRAECADRDLSGDGPAAWDPPAALPLAWLPASPDFDADRPGDAAPVAVDAPSREFAEPPA